jgi:hypothetical protein
VKVTTVQDLNGKVFCLLPNEPFMFDPFQIKSIREVTQSRPGSREEYAATQLSWIDGTWTVIETGFDEVVDAISSAWERYNHEDKDPV